MTRYMLVIFVGVCFADKSFSESLCDNVNIYSNRASLGSQALSECKEKGDHFFLEGNTDKAKKEYAKLLHLMLNLSLNLSKRIITEDYSFAHPSRAEYDDYAERGFLCIEKGDFPGAVVSFSKVIEINNLYPYGYIMRALAYRGEHLYDLALADLEKLIILYPSFYYPHSLRGEILYEQKKLSQALVSLNKAIELAPDSSESYFLRGNVLSDMGNPPDALKDYSKAIEISKDIRAFYNRGVLYFSNEQYDKALPDFIYISENEPVGSPYLRQVYWRIANIYIAENSYESAIKFLDKLINIQPYDPWAYQQKGCVYMQMKMYNEALASFELALKFDPASSEIKRWIKDAQKEMGKGEGSARTLRHSDD